MDVLLLTKPACHLCDHAKAVLDRVAGEFGLTVRVLQLNSAEGRRLAQEHGLLFAPGVLIDGMPFSYGRLSERKLRRELASKTERLRKT